MDLPTPSSEAGAAGLRAVLERPRDASLAFDFDGVLSPIVPDPEQARPHPGVIPVLGRLASMVGSMSIITGREVATVLRLGDLGELAARDNFAIHGLYGMQRWDPASQRVVSTVSAPGIAEVREQLPALIEALDISPGVVIEDKGMSLVVHTRRARDPRQALTTLLEPVTELAGRYDLTVEPGRQVLEIRPPGVNKGNVLSTIVRERGAHAVAYFGDDLGDLPAFDTVERLRETGVAGLTVCSGSDEVEVLASRADLVVDGPPGVLAFLDRLVDALGTSARQ
jgi:trehalose 6-phosphate phosphatase